MDKRQQFKEFFGRRSIVDHVPVQVTNQGLNHEVFDPKGKHFLEFNHFIEDSDAPKGLSTVTRTTHGFKLTRKGALYLPRELKDSVKSLLDPYAVPIKPKHRDPQGNRDIDAIGRVTGGRYVDDFGVNNPRFSINDSINGDYKSQNTMKAVRDALKSQVLLDSSFRGLGYMVVDGVVHDPSAIEKILDGRYLTVSVEMTPSDWINPMTGNSWEDDILDVDYMPGDIVDGIPAIIVAGALKQEGYAYTTHPADVYASTLQHGRSEILDSIVERSKTPMFIIDKNMGDKLSNIFDGIMLSKDEIITDSVEEANSKTCNCDCGGCNTSGGNDMKELLDTYVASVKENATFDKAKELYQTITDASDEEMAKAFESNLDSLTISGLPIDNVKVLEAVQPALADVEDASVKTRIEAIAAVIQSNSHPGDKNRGNTDSDSSIVTDNDTGESMKVEDIITFLKENTEAVTAILDAFELVNKGDLEAATAKVAELEKSVQDSADNANLVRIYKEQLQSSMVEAVETKAALDSAVRDHRETLAQLEFLAKLVTDKDNAPEGPVVVKDKTLAEIQDSVGQLVSGFDASAAREKLFGLAKEVEDATGVEDPTAAVGDDKKPEGIEDNAPTFSKNEISVATRYGEKLKAGKKSEAANYLKRMKRNNLVADSFDPNTVLEALGGETK